MALDHFISKFYKFPYIEKDKMREFLLSEDIDKWGFFGTLYPLKAGEDLFILATVNNLSVFDKLEDELGATEIDALEYRKAADWLNMNYSQFYPSVDISDFSG